MTPGGESHPSHAGVEEPPPGETGGAEPDSQLRAAAPARGVQVAAGPPWDEEWNEERYA
ncbi:hypothetical protein GCM10027612_68410 [Microbispora bryophytorum subsp. camponoti]